MGWEMENGPKSPPFLTKHLDCIVDGTVTEKTEIRKILFLWLSPRRLPGGRNFLGAFCFVRRMGLSLRPGDWSVYVLVGTSVCWA